MAAWTNTRTGKSFVRALRLSPWGSLAWGSTPRRSQLQPGAMSHTHQSWPPDEYWRPGWQREGGDNGKPRIARRSHHHLLPPAFFALPRVRSGCEPRSRCITDPGEDNYTIDRQRMTAGQSRGYLAQAEHAILAGGMWQSSGVTSLSFMRQRRDEGAVGFPNPESAGVAGSIWLDANHAGARYCRYNRCCPPAGE
jgi:hypothetical protein